MEGFKKLKVWQHAYYFGLDLYKITRAFPDSERFGLASQLQRSAISISANIAEGYERQHRKEYIQFLYVACGSLGEVENYLLFSRDLGYIDNNTYEAIEEKRQEVAKTLMGLIKSLVP